MAELKTKPTSQSAEEFIAALPDAARRADCTALLMLMRRVTKAQPVMWGAAMVGFGHYHYKYATGHEGDWFITGFAPRKNDLTIYVMAGFEGREELLSRLGPHRLGKSCLYIRRLAGLDVTALEELIKSGVEQMKRHAAAGGLGCAGDHQPAGSKAPAKSGSGSRGRS